MEEKVKEAVAAFEKQFAADSLGYALAHGSDKQRADFEAFVAGLLAQPAPKK